MLQSAGSRALQHFRIFENRGEETMIDLTYIHPMIVHFPIALLLVGFLAELAGMVLRRDFFSQVAFTLIMTGAVGVIAAYLSGERAGGGITEAGTMKMALEAHESSALLTLWLVIATALLRAALVVFRKFSGSLRWASLALFLAAVLSIARTGHHGGELVFKHAAGVRLELGLGISPRSESERD